MTHHIPVGVFFGIKSVIGPGCVLDPVQFMKEIKELEAGGIKTKGKIFIAKNTHIITEENKNEDGSDSKIGTTKRGNGPTYRNKYARTGIRAESVPELKPYLIDLYEEFHVKNKNTYVLGEGAQGFGLDIDWGDYPFVTSSHCTVGGMILNAVPFTAIKDVWGVAKIYETYVGNKKFEPADKIFEEIRKVGEEYGSTTGRPRQCNWMNLNLMERAIRMNGVNRIVLSKMDVLRKVGQWAVLDGKKKIAFKSEKEMKDFLLKKFAKMGIAKKNVYFSEHKDKI